MSLERIHVAPCDFNGAGWDVRTTFHHGDTPSLAGTPLLWKLGANSWPWKDVCVCDLLKVPESEKG